MNKYAKAMTTESNRRRALAYKDCGEKLDEAENNNSQQYYNHFSEEEDDNGQ